MGDFANHSPIRKEPGLFIIKIPVLPFFYYAKHQYLSLSIKISGSLKCLLVGICCRYIN